jgi:hypothetical protein
MFKASLAPTIALALYQIHAFAEYYTTLGYLVIIMAILSMANMPRAKFLQMLVVTISFALFAAALSMLAIYCCVRARDGDVAAYSSSASAIGALWLIIQIFMMSALRAKLPHLTVPCIMWAIFANTSMIYGPQFPNMAAAEAFMKQLLVAILTGYGIGAVISLLVFPLNSRQVVFGEIAAYIASLRGVLKANLDYMQSLEREDMFAATATNTLHENPPKSEEAKVLKKRINALSALHGKLSADLPFAKREIAIGKLGPDDLQDILKLLRLVVVPCSGLSCMADIFVRIAEDSGWDQNIDLHDAQPQDAHNEGEKMRIEAINEWHALMKRLRGPFEKITQTIDDGLEHVRIVLQLGGKSSKARHLEDGLDPQPGHPEFAAHFRRLSTELDGSKKIMLREWCHLHDIQLPDNFFDDGKTDFDAPQWMHEHMLAEPHRKLRRQLFMCLYMEFLLISISRRTYRLIVRVDAFREGGKLSKKRLVVPGYKRMRKWFQSLFTDTHDVHGENEEGLDSKVYLGDAYKRRKDPEHLPPANAWEKFGEQVREWVWINRIRADYCPAQKNPTFLPVASRRVWSACVCCYHEHRYRWIPPRYPKISHPTAHILGSDYGLYFQLTNGRAKLTRLLLPGVRNCSGLLDLFNGMVFRRAKHCRHNLFFFRGHARWYLYHDEMAAISSGRNHLPDHSGSHHRI